MLCRVAGQVVVAEWVADGNRGSSCCWSWELFGGHTNLFVRGSYGLFCLAAAEWIDAMGDSCPDKCAGLAVDLLLLQQ